MKFEWYLYSTLLLPLGLFIVLVKLYRKKKQFANQIKLTHQFVKRELARKRLELKALGGREVWEYPEEIRNHPLSVDLDLCKKTGLVPFLDVTISSQGFDRFLKKLLQIEPFEGNLLQKKVKSYLGDGRFLFQILRKSIIPGEENSKLDLGPLDAKESFWKKHPWMRYFFPVLGVFTPIYLLLSSIFSLPFVPLLLFVNAMIFLRHRKESLGYWNEIERIGSIASNVSYAWIRMFPKARQKTKRMCVELTQLKNDKEWIVSILPHFLLNVIFLWDFWKIRRFQKWYDENAQHWSEMRNQWIELESNLPAAQFAYLNPEYEFPIWNSSAQLSADSIVHPLIPFSMRVINPVHSIQQSDLVIITGSNMSGKTTYLRTIAVNLMLAGIGAPCSGKNVQLPAVKIHTLIRSQDSLEDGISFFYSEVRRLASILNAKDDQNLVPILFFDEILKGTNSKERKIATEEILLLLRKKGAIVFVTTHDLDLASLQDAKLFHFTELEENGEMKFDYQIRLGISQSTNALRILQKEGIPISKLS
ncbi:MutS domain V protein [Leptospira ryugenii]|uniref:MutS domain V protein n=1 Tax=Leptospira ryugenii TaxID=1917863 RepID=A0A2P2E2B9_9LEPT|nr:DNA mismatch repair protein [Leptospira ryugenii]GBF51042.1 MutS domain V protein [Leptospira ryugenii]